MSDIFVSYAKEDQNRAKELASALEAKGWSVWWDRHIPVGRTFDETIEEALVQARCVIVLWSAQSIASRWVRAEASVAADRSILVPVLIDSVSIPLEFRRMQAANLIGWTGNADNPEFRKVLVTIGLLLAPGSDKKAAPGVANSATKRISVPWIRSRLALALLLLVGGGGILTYALLSRDRSSRPPQSEPAANVQEPTNQAEATLGRPTPAGDVASARTVPMTGRLNLLSQKNGGHLVAAPHASWATTNDDAEDWSQLYDAIGDEAVYGFKNEQPATFDTFLMLVTEQTTSNVKEFELLAGDLPDGYFQSVGKFETRNVRLFPSAWQEFKFGPVRAKYLKFRLISAHGSKIHPDAYEWQLLGSF